MIERSQRDSAFVSIKIVCLSKMQLKNVLSSNINKSYNLHTNIGKFILKSEVDYRIQKNSDFKG